MVKWSPGSGVSYDTCEPSRGRFRNRAAALVKHRPLRWVGVALVLVGVAAIVLLNVVSAISSGQ
jgi:hypothetical protein